MIISPDPEKEDAQKDLDMWEMTKEIVRWLEEHLGNRDIPFIAAEHNDHTEKRHIHALMLMQRKGREMLITKDTIEALREAANAEVILQRDARDYLQTEEKRQLRQSQRPRTAPITPPRDRQAR